MERKKWNELKKQILELARNSKTVTSKDVATALNCEIHNAGMALNRMFKQRLLTKRTMTVTEWRKPLYQYSLTDRGLARLQYFEGLEREVSK